VTRVGVLALQGGVAEHVYMLRRASEQAGIPVDIVLVKRREQLSDLAAIVVPGGESTTIGKLMQRLGLIQPLQALLEDGAAAMGTCAGAAIMASVVKDRVVGETNQPLLAVMDIEVVRNYFGRQRESFEAPVEIPVLGEKPFPGVFIRAPAIVRAWGGAKIIARLSWASNVGVAAVQDNKIALAFHPELTSDTRLHKMLIELAKR